MAKNNRKTNNWDRIAHLESTIPNLATKVEIESAKVWMLRSVVGVLILAIVVILFFFIQN